MKQKLITDVVQAMLPYLNNAQIEKLQEALLHSLSNYKIVVHKEAEPEAELNLVELFLSAKRIEGCSEKSLKYYESTIMALLDGVGKSVKYIGTEDIRVYLTEYQARKQSSKVTMDNIRRILSSFFSWLEDEDYILKSPVRRIHKVKTGTCVKETYTDEALELMRDNCTELRDLAIIDMLASTGMRVGELVGLNIDDIDFTNKECVVFGKGSKERIVFFGDYAKKYLNKYLNEAREELLQGNKSDYLLINYQGGNLTRRGVEQIVNDIVKKVFEPENDSIYEIIAKTILHKFFAVYSSLKKPAKYMDTYVRKFALTDRRIKYIKDGKKRTCRVVSVAKDTCAITVDIGKGELIQISSPSGVITPNKIKV